MKFVFEKNFEIPRARNCKGLAYFRIKRRKPIRSISIKVYQKNFKNSTLLSPIKSVTIIQFLQNSCITSECRKILPLFHQIIQFAFTIFRPFLNKKTINTQNIFLNSIDKILLII